VFTAVCTIFYFVLPCRRASNCSTPDSVVVDTATAKLVNYSGVGTSVYNFRNVPGETADYILRFISRGYEVQCTPFRLHYYRRKTDYE